MPAKSRLTDRSHEVLSNLARGRSMDYGVRGQSAYGGLEGTRYALQSRGLIEYDRDAGAWVLTDAGWGVVRLTCLACYARVVRRSGSSGRYEWTTRLDGTDTLGSGSECPKNERGHIVRDPKGTR